MQKITNRHDLKKIIFIWKKSHVFIFLILMFFPSLSIFAESNDVINDESNDVINYIKLLKELQNINTELDKINFSNSIGYMIGIFIAFIAIMATIYNSMKLNRQLNIHEREMKYRIRPILVRGRFDDGNTFSIRDNDKITEKRFWIKLTNTGPLPAINIKRKIRGGIIKDSDKLEPLKNIPYIDISMSSMGPTEYVDNIIRLSDEEFKELSEGENYFFELKFDYTEPEDINKKYYYHIKGHFEKKNLVQDFIDMN